MYGTWASDFLKCFSTRIDDETLAIAAIMYLIPQDKASLRFQHRYYPSYLSRSVLTAPLSWAWAHGL